MELVPPVAGLFPVGRLDLTTEGLLLLTNDGAFAERVAHPRYEVPRVYHAKVHKVPDPETLERLRRGVRVEGERLVGRPGAHPGGGEQRLARDHAARGQEPRGPPPAGGGRASRVQAAARGAGTAHHARPQAGGVPLAHAGRGPRPDGAARRARGQRLRARDRTPPRAAAPAAPAAPRRRVRPAARVERPPSRGPARRRARRRRGGRVASAGGRGAPGRLAAPARTEPPRRDRGRPRRGRT